MQRMDGWVDLLMPNGCPCPLNPLVGPETFPLAAGKTLGVCITHNVPASAPLGTYHYMTKVGEYPAILWDDDGFNFTIVN